MGQQRSGGAKVEGLSVRAGFGEGWGAVGAEDSRSGESDHHTGHVVENLAGEPEGTPPGQAKLTVELDGPEGECEATPGEAGPFGPAVDEIEEVREAFVSSPEDPGVAGDVEPRLEFNGVEGDGWVGGDVGDPVSATRVAGEDYFVVTIPVVSGLDGAQSARLAPGHGEPDAKAVFKDVGEAMSQGGHWQTQSCWRG